MKFAPGTPVVWIDANNNIRKGKVANHQLYVKDRVSVVASDNTQAHPTINRVAIDPEAGLLEALERLVACVIEDESIQRAAYQGTVMGQCMTAIAKAKGK